MSISEKTKSKLSKIKVKKIETDKMLGFMLYHLNMLRNMNF